MSNSSIYELIQGVTDDQPQLIFELLSLSFFTNALSSVVNNSTIHKLYFWWYFEGIKDHATNVINSE